MRRWVLVVLLAAACLVAISSFHTSAQVTDATPCAQSCREQKSLCVSDCGTGSNPIECEEQCQDEFLDCMKQCR